MLKNLLKLSALFLFTLTFSVTGVWASGKMEVPLGELVTLQAEAPQPGLDYKWVITKDKAIINTQSGTAFAYTFDVQGEYKVNLTLSDNAGSVLKSTTVSIMVGKRYSKPVTGSTGGNFDDPLQVSVQTLPAMDENGVINILGEKGTVVFDIEFKPDFLNYKIDRNILVDSDGNGIPNDDEDNAADSSYLLAGIWRSEYARSEGSQITAEITLVSTSGKKITKQIPITFEDFAPSSGNIRAILDSLPPINVNDNKIYVYDDRDTVAFYARRSEGNILEYRIDANIFADSDGDGNPSNDIDNRSDNSFKTGDVWTTEYTKTGQQIIAQLIVVGQGGAGSRIQREIVFIPRPVAPVTEEGQEGGIRLTADKEFVQKGDPIEFRVEGLTQAIENYTFDWDFDGDGTYDQTIEGSEKASYIFDAPGTPVISVRVMDKAGNDGTFTYEILVQDVAVTAANFEFEVKDLTVTFKNTSTAAANLNNKSLTYLWSFGDPDEANYEKQRDQINVVNPVYTYAKPGNYVVTLTVTDADQVSNTKTTEITVGDLSAPSTPAEEQASDEEAASESSLIGKIFKVILYIVLVIVLLILLIVGGLLIFLKIQNPDLIFEELIDELKIKILSMLGLHDVFEEEHPSSASMPGVTGGVIPPYRPQSGGAQAPKSEASTSSGSGAQSSATVNVNVDLSKPDAPVPAWMKTTPPAANKPNVIEGELVKPNATPTIQKAPEPKKEPELKPQASDGEPKPVDKIPPPPVPKAETPALKPQNQATKPTSSPSGHGEGSKPTPSSPQKPTTPTFGASTSSKPNAVSQTGTSNATNKTNDTPPSGGTTPNPQAKDLSKPDGPAPDWLKPN